MRKTHWEIDHEVKPTTPGVMYIHRTWPDGVHERKLINTAQLHHYIKPERPARRMNDRQTAVLIKDMLLAEAGVCFHVYKGEQDYYDFYYDVSGYLKKEHAESEDFFDVIIRKPKGRIMVIEVDNCGKEAMKVLSKLFRKIETPVKYGGNNV